MQKTIEKQYSPEAVFSIRVKNKKLTLPEFTNLSPEQIDKIEVLKGHMMFGLHTHFKGVKVKYITMLREPIFIRFPALAGRCPANY